MSCFSFIIHSPFRRNVKGINMHIQAEIAVKKNTPKTK